MQRYRSVLLIDDDPIGNFLTERMLCKFRCAGKIAVALNGQQAMDILEKEFPEEDECPDLIFLDINMPVMNGFEFLERFKRDMYKGASATRIVVLTSSANTNDHETVRSYGIRDIVQKPLTETKMKELLLDVTIGQHRN